jgi:hypothetical protein
MELWLPWLYITAAGSLFVGSLWLFWKKKVERKSAHLAIRIVGRITSPILFLATIFLLLGVGRTSFAANWFTRRSARCESFGDSWKCGRSGLFHSNCPS